MNSIRISAGFVGMLKMVEWSLTLLHEYMSINTLIWKEQANNCKLPWIFLKFASMFALSLLITTNMVWNGPIWVKFEFYFTIKFKIEQRLVTTNPGPKESSPWKIFSMPKNILQILVLSTNYNGIDYFLMIQKEGKLHYTMLL